MENGKRGADGGVQLCSPPSKIPRTDPDGRDLGPKLIEIDGKACTHEVAWPAGLEGSLAAPAAREGPPAREYPFPLDPFQKVAINALEAGHSVLVAAHTSAGKTVVAEYAFAMALRDNTRVVYTSPLKALSNQKYRELYEEFQDVGLMTGDVTINPTASCLVMTTEILRSMLYRGSEVVREVQLIVYDEIHYLRDKERGVVWEESIILAPKSARFAFLSATIPNAREFADWVARIHMSPCHVVYTDYRPTPLQHYIYPSGADGLFMVVDESGKFREDNFQKAIGSLAEDPRGRRGKDKKGTVEGGKNELPAIHKIVRMIMERNYDPVIVFSFSKKECESLGMEMSTLDLTDEAEKKLIDGIFWNAMDCLSVEDRKLPQISRILPLLKRGIGVHHSGLLPILKEVIEILFQEGLLKVLFATETFSTGLNMPAKTVVFTNARKFDGGGFRWVTSGEYIQMSGRAGRRGLDDRGIVILMLDTRMEPAIAKNMIKGAPDTLYSEFHLGYNMLINLMKVEGASPEELMRRSYRQFQLQRSLPQLEERVEKLEEERKAVVVEDEEQVEGFLGMLQLLVKLRAELRHYLQQPEHLLPFLQPGRLVRILPSPVDEKNPLPDFRCEPDMAVSDVPRNSKKPVKAGDSRVFEGPEAPSLSDVDRIASNAEASTSGAVVELALPGVWGAVVNFEKRKKRSDGKGPGADEEEADAEAGGKRKSPHQFIVDVLINVESSTAAGSQQSVRILPPGDKGTAMVVSFPLTQVDQASSIRVHLSKDLKPPENCQAALKNVNEAIKRLIQQHGHIPLLDMEDDMKINDKALRKLLSKLEGVEKFLQESPLMGKPNLIHRLGRLQHKQELAVLVKLAKKEVKSAQNLILIDELKARQRVLRRLGYVDDEELVTMKGRVAAEVQSADELVLTEMLFGGVFNGMTPELVAATCSCFVWREKNDGGSRLGEDFQHALGALRNAARVVAKLEEECKRSVDVEEYVQSFRPELMEVVAAWARGNRFADCMKMVPTFFEGSLVRAMRRLEEVMRQVEDALKGVGELELAEVFGEAIRKIKRDVVFAASLYL